MKRSEPKEETSMAHPDLDTLLNPLLSFAQQMLARQGTFFPFGASMRTDGKIAMAAGYTGGTRMEPVAIIDPLLQGVQREAATGAVRAAGIGIERRVVRPGDTVKTDAICVELDKVEGACVDVYLPYKKGWLGRFKFGQTFAVSRDARVFATRRQSE